jgi:hypoxanthine-DNA glycosylase
MPLKSFKPIINETSEVLILGSMPSVKSLEQQEYYAHPQNRFWKVMAELCNYPDLHKSEFKIKTDILLKNHIALWDVVKTCNRNGSLDSAIENVKPNDIKTLLKKYPEIKKIYCNGTASYTMFNRYFKDINLPVTKLPSTSPANAKYKLETLLEDWTQVIT